jgi:hypothetical protein
VVKIRSVDYESLPVAVCDLLNGETKQRRHEHEPQRYRGHREAKRNKRFRVPMRSPDRRNLHFTQVPFFAILAFYAVCEQPFDIIAAKDRKDLKEHERVFCGLCASVVIKNHHRDTEGTEKAQTCRTPPNH